VKPRNITHTNRRGRTFLSNIIQINIPFVKRLSSKENINKFTVDKIVKQKGEG
jgi:hypothetical protein